MRCMSTSYVRPGVIIPCVFDVVTDILSKCLCQIHHYFCNNLVRVLDSYLYSHCIAVEDPYRSSPKACARYSILRHGNYITVGHNENSFPFLYRTPRHDKLGYHDEHLRGLCRYVHCKIKVNLEERLTYLSFDCMLHRIFQFYFRITNLWSD